MGSRKAPFSSLVTSGSRPSLLLRCSTTSVWFAPSEAIHGDVGSKKRSVVTLWPLGMDEREGGLVWELKQNIFLALQLDNTRGIFDLSSGVCNKRT